MNKFKIKKMSNEAQLHDNWTYATIPTEISASYAN